MYQVYVLQKYVAKKIGIELGPITTTSISAHVFEEQFEYIEKLIS